MKFFLSKNWFIHPVDAAPAAVYKTLRALKHTHTKASVLFAFLLLSPRRQCGFSVKGLNATHHLCMLAPCAYPLQPPCTGQQQPAQPRSAASPLLRSSHTSPSLLQHPSWAPSIRRALLRGLPAPRGDLHAHHSSNRETYPVDKLLKFRS